MDKREPPNSFVLNPADEPDLVARLEDHAKKIVAPQEYADDFRRAAKMIRALKRNVIKGARE